MCVCVSLLFSLPFLIKTNNPSPKRKTWEPIIGVHRNMILSTQHHKTPPLNTVRRSGFLSPQLSSWSQLDELFLPHGNFIVGIKFQHLSPWDTHIFLGLAIYTAVVGFIGRGSIPESVTFASSGKPHRSHQELSLICINCSRGFPEPLF